MVPSAVRAAPTQSEVLPAGAPLGRLGVLKPTGAADGRRIDRDPGGSAVIRCWLDGFRMRRTLAATNRNLARVLEETVRDSNRILRVAIEAQETVHRLVRERDILQAHLALLTGRRPDGSPLPEA